MWRVRPEIPAAYDVHSFTTTFKKKDVTFKVGDAMVVNINDKSGETSEFVAKYLYGVTDPVSKTIRLVIMWYYAPNMTPQGKKPGDDDKEVIQNISLPFSRMSLPQKIVIYQLIE